MWDLLRIIAASLIGVWISVWLTNRCLQSVDIETEAAKGRQYFEDHKARFIVANLLVYFSIALGIGAYLSGCIAESDWRGAGIIFAGIVILPLSWLSVTQLLKNDLRWKLMFMAFASSNNTSPRIFYIVSAVILMFGILSTLSFLR